MGKSQGLFFKNAFRDPQGNWPSELQWCCTTILVWCGRLPFAIFAIDALLAKKLHAKVDWIAFYGNLGYEIRPGSSLEIISSVLQPSSMDLSNHLKTCFQYLSIFPADYRFRAQRLTHLWVAEGFVKPRRGITVEQVAQGYLNELIERNLVLAEVDGQELSFLVVGFVRDFIISKAENFITIWKPDCRNNRNAGEHIHRLSIHGASYVDLHLLSSGLDLKHIRTLLVFGGFSHSDLAMVLKTSKFLRVLDAEEGSSDLIESVDGLIFLKYLRLEARELKTVPKSIRKLRFLETLDLEDTGLLTLPKEICQLYNLRHLLVPYYGVQISAGDIGALSSIQSLKIEVRNNRRLIKALGELKDLRKLEVLELEERDGKELCIALEKMKHLSTLDVRAVQSLDLDHMQSCPPLYLQHLRLSGHLEELPKWISKLTSLRKLGLEFSCLKVDPLDIIQALPNLLELKLMKYYSGEELVFRADTFEKLMVLRIELFHELNLMVIEDGALPMLKELTLFHCERLKSLPHGIDGHKSLHKLSLLYMPDEFVAKLQMDSPHRQMIRHIPGYQCH